MFVCKIEIFGTDMRLWISLEGLKIVWVECEHLYSLFGNLVMCLNVK